MTTAICGQKALLLRRSLTVGGKEHSLGSLVESRGTVLKAVSLDFRKPLHLPADRQGRPTAPGSQAQGLPVSSQNHCCGIELASRAVLDRNRQGQSLGAED